MTVKRIYADWFFLIFSTGHWDEIMKIVIESNEFMDGSLYTTIFSASDLCFMEGTPRSSCNCTSYLNSSAYLSCLFASPCFNYSPTLMLSEGYYIIGKVGCRSPMRTAMPSILDPMLQAK